MIRTVAMLAFLLIVLETLPVEAKRMGIPGRRGSGGTRAVPAWSSNIESSNIDLSNKLGELQGLLSI